VPIIVVFTKFDLFVDSLGKQSAGEGKNNLELAEEDFKERYDQAFERSTEDVGGHVPYVLVTSKFNFCQGRFASLTSYSYAT